MGSNKSVAHNWANASVKGAKKGSSFFRELWDDNKVSIAYSFGHHYVAGIVDTVNGRVFINEYVYSHYTGRHLGLCRRAVNKMLTPEQYEVSSEGMDQLECLLKGQMRKEYDERWHGIVYATKRDNALKSISAYKGKMTKEGLPRLSVGCAWRYEYAIEAANEARAFNGQKSIKADPVLVKKYADYRQGDDDRKAESVRRAKIAERKRYLASLKTPEKYAEWQNERLGFKDSGDCDHWSRQPEPITLTVDGNHVKASNDNQVTIHTARRLIGIWEKAIATRSSFCKKDMSVGNYTGVIMRYNGIVKIGCTRILPDEVLKLRNVLQTTGVGNGIQTGE